MQMNKASKYRYLAFLLAVSTVLITFGSMCSFLFPVHTGVDQNVFFTIGESLLDGKVMYRDAWDQKGPLLYFMHTFAALFSRDSFFGVYLLEIVNLFVVLLYVGKISDLFLERKHRNLVVALTGLITITTFCFSRGDNAEEFCMPFLVIGLYHMICYLNSEEKQFSNKLMILHGIFAACILWIKFTMLGFYIGWCLLIGLTLWNRKQFKYAIYAALYFLLGMFIGTLPYLIYFMATGAMDDFYFGAIYSNVFMYSRKVRFVKRIEYFFMQDILYNPVMMPLSLLGVAVFTASKKWLGNITARSSIAVTYISTYVFVFIGGTRYKYYLLIMAVYTVFGVIVGVKYFESSIEKMRQHKKAWVSGCIVVFMVALFAFSNVMPYFFKKWEEYPQLQFAKIINASEDKTLMNYNFLDGGFYLMADAPLPKTKYFCRPNFPREAFPELYEEQEAAIKNKETEFVVMRYGRNRILEEFVTCNEVYQNYELVATSYDEVDDYYFALLKRKK